MTVTTNAGFDAVAASPVATPINLVEMDFATATLYLTTWPVDVVYSGQPYQGIGVLGRIGEMRESEDGNTQSLDLELSQVNATLLGAALGSVSNYQGRAVRVKLALADSTGVIQGAPVLRFSGFMDLVKISRQEGQGIVTMSCKTGGYDLRKNPTALRLNDQQHQAERPGELGLAYVADLIGKPQQWLSKRFQQV